METVSATIQRKPPPTKRAWCHPAPPSGARLQGLGRLDLVSGACIGASGGGLTLDELYVHRTYDTSKGCWGLGTLSLEPAPKLQRRDDSRRPLWVLGAEYDAMKRRVIGIGASRVADSNCICYDRVRVQQMVRGGNRDTGLSCRSREAVAVLETLKKGQDRGIRPLAAMTVIQGRELVNERV